jgi:hypothetical protein
MSEQSTMTRADAAKVLQAHNAWRRHTDDEQQSEIAQHPRVIGQAMDMAVIALRLHFADVDALALQLARKIVALHPETHPGGQHQYLATVQVLIADATRQAIGETA